MPSLVPCQVEGPYESSPASPNANSDVTVLIAGGLGVTPLLGMLRSWAASSNSPSSGRSPRGIVYLLWSSRSLEELELMDSALVQIAG